MNDSLREGDTVILAAGSRKGRQVKILELGLYRARVVEQRGEPFTVRTESLGERTAEGRLTRMMREQVTQVRPGKVDY